MRNAILGAVGGILLGSMGALAYTRIVSDNALDDLQAKLDSANADLASLKAAKSRLARETTGASSQIDDLEAANADLKKQLDDAKAGTTTPTAAPPPPAISPAMVAGMVMSMMRGGGMQPQQRLLLLQTRLKLTPNQVTAVKAALEADAKARGEAMRAMFRNGGKPDGSAPATNLNSLDKVLADTLTPMQMSQYQQVQADEKAARAETQATIQVNQMAPLMQFSDSQKEQVLNALYAVQSSAPDPMSLVGNPNAMTTLTKQAQTTQDTLAKVLTPDQMSLYQQEAAVTPQFGGGGFGRRGGNGGGGNGNGGGAPGAAPAPPTTATAPTAPVTTYATAAVPAPTPATATDTSASTNAAAATAATTNSPSATTNAAPTQ